jgi:serine/threonine-protein kinase
VTNAREDELPFERLGDYDVIAPISQGGMASVWLGRSTAHPEQLVALKVIRPEHGRNKEFVAMFVDEAHLATRLVHPNIVSILGVGYDGKQHFLAMEVLRGRTLLAVYKAAHNRGKRLPYEVVAWIGARIADALHYAHELVDDKGSPENVVHRDVNPANIFLTKEGAPKLIDFGLAKARDRIASTAIGVVKGKLAYLAPEQAQGKQADRRSDVFALGVTLWEASLDRRLFLDDTDVETIRRVREAQVPNPTSLDAQYPRPLADALVRALARDPASRWETAAAFRDALDGAIKSMGRKVDASTVRARLAEFFDKEEPLSWERWVDEAVAEREKTRVWEGASGSPLAAQAEPAVALPAPLERRPATGARLRMPPFTASPRLLAIAGGCSALGVLFVALAARGCRGDRYGKLERRLAHVEDMLGIEDAGSSSPAASPAAASLGSAASVAEDRSTSGPCAVAKVIGYQAWQEAVGKAKASAKSAEGNCSSIWSDTKKQACYYAATANVRAAQAARDAFIAGGAAAHDAVNNVKDDPKNDAIAHARAASEAAFAACDGDGGS